MWLSSEPAVLIFLLIMFPSVFSILDAGRKGKVSADSILPQYRINDSFIPSHYDIEIKLPVPGSEFGEKGVEGGGLVGKVRITGVSHVRQNFITLHSPLTTAIKNASVTVAAQGGPEEEWRRIAVTQLRPEFESLFSIEVERVINPGEKLEIAMEFFSGIAGCELSWALPLCTNLPDPYTPDPDDFGDKSYYLTAIPHHFTTFFPGFHESHLKSTFDMTILRREGYSSVFNSELVSSTINANDTGWVTDKFARTPNLATDFIAFFVSNVKHINASSGNKSIRVHGPPKLIPSETYKMTGEKAVRILDAYDTFFNDTSRVPKMDLVVFPTKSVGWMTWGAIVYDTESKYDTLDYPYQDSGNKRHVAEQETLRLTYILARQWIGTMWNENRNMFMNFPLTRYLQYSGIKAALTDETGLDAVILRDMQDAMLSDTDKDAVPLNETDTPYRGIPTNRGVSLLRMVESVLGRSTMQKALQSYVLKVNENDQTGPNDLFQSFQEAVDESRVPFPGNLTVSEFLSDWCYVSGYPVVKVEVVNQTHVKLSQERFSRKGDAMVDDRWNIPVTYVTQSDPANVQLVWLEDEIGSEVTINVNTSQWLLVNPDATGYYRTLYDTPLLQNLAAQLKSNASTVSGLSRSMLVNDYVVFSNEELVNSTTALTLTSHLGQETHLSIWRNLLDLKYNQITSLPKFKSHPQLPVIQKYYKDRVVSVLNQIGTNSSISASILKDDLSRFMCNLTSSGSLCVEFANNTLKEWKASTEFKRGRNFPTNVKCALVAGGGKDALDLVFAEYNKLRKYYPDSYELAEALGCTTDRVLIKELLHGLLKGADTDNFDNENPFLALASNSEGQAEILEFLSTNLEPVIAKIGRGKVTVVARILGQLADHFSTQDQLDKMTTFLETNKLKLMPEIESIKTSLRKIEKNIAWMEATGKDILTWYSAQ